MGVGFRVYEMMLCVCREEKEEVLFMRKVEDYNNYTSAPPPPPPLSLSVATRPRRKDAKSASIRIFKNMQQH